MSISSSDTFFTRDESSADAGGNRSKIRIVSEKVSEPPPELWSNCVSVGPLVYLSGLTARESSSAPILEIGEYEQAKIVFGKMRELLAATGCVMNDIVKLTIFVTNISNNTEVWRARREFFTGDFPACTLVEVSALARQDILLEIEGVAYRGAGVSAA